MSVMHERPIGRPHSGARSRSLPDPLAELPRVSTIFVRALIEAVETAGVPADEFVRAAGVSMERLTESYGWMDVAELDRLTQRAVDLTGDSAFGLHWVERSPLMKFELLAMIIASAPTLREALGCLLRFQSLVYERPELEMVESEDRVQLRVCPVASTELGLRVRTEMAVLAFVRLMRYVGAPSEAVLRIAFVHRAPDYAHEYARLFEGRACFGQARSGIEIDPSWLDRRLHHANVELFRLLIVQGERVLANIQSTTGYSGQVRAYLRRLFPRLPQMPEAARALALSERSLRRRLSEEGLSYSAILQESQLRLAQQLLADPTLSIQQIGHDVGFTSITAFHRAFKRWTGESPAAFRNTRLSPQAGTPRGALEPRPNE
jgi:AraC-like DNA-binding protein